MITVHPPVITLKAQTGSPTLLTSLSCPRSSQPQAQMVVPNFPPEIVDRIIDMLFGDNKSLCSCLQVSTSWAHRSRHNLFANVELRSLSDLYGWFWTGLGPSSHRARSLRLSTKLSAGSEWMIPKKLAISRYDFTPFWNVKYLSLADLDLTPFDEESLTRYFGHFSNRLTSLRAERLTVHPDALLFFVCMFPKLDSLELDNLKMGRARVRSRIPATTPRLQGNLALKNLRHNESSLIAFLAVLPIAFEYVCVEDCGFETPKLLNDLFAACRETMKKVKVSRVFFGGFHLRGMPP